MNVKTLKMYGELLNKIRDLIRSKTHDLDNYDENYMKIKFNSNDDLPLKKTLQLRDIVIIARFVCYEDNKYYAQIL